MSPAGREIEAPRDPVTAGTRTACPQDRSEPTTCRPPARQCRRADLVELRQLERFLGVEDDGAKLSDHGLGVAVLPAAQTTGLLNVLTLCPGRCDDGVLGVWHRTAAEGALLPRVRFPAGTIGRGGRVQAGDGAVCRRRAFDGHRRSRGRRATARDHDGTRTAGDDRGAALQRDGRQIHRRRDHGGIRRPGGVGGPRFSRVPCRSRSPDAGKATHRRRQGT